jgi:A/G-specific adenine glycosylase
MSACEPRGRRSESSTAIRAALLGWYASVARDLPWRRTRDAYAVWVSEIMLQQTRVETVVPYFERFMARFPTVAALAAAPEEDVLSAWSGLGYYRRARTLRLAAAEVVASHGGELPRTAEGLRALPGIGAYTAGAIASIAFGERAALVDGNVTRVLSRLFAVDDDVSRAAGQRRIWELAEALVDPERPGDFNQALMDLGATVCTPRPTCSACPVRASCRGRERADELPRSRPKKKPRALAMVALVAAHAESGDVLLGHRRGDGLFGGLWEPLLYEGRDASAARPALVRAGLDPRAALMVAGEVEHTLTHRHLHVLVTTAAARRRWRLPAEAPAPYQALAWRAPAGAALSTLARKILRAAASVALCLALLCVAGGASADEQAAPADDGDEGDLTEKDLELYKELNEPRGGYGRMFFTVSGGKGLRFNNPFRLRTQLGESAESVSATAGYVDLSLNGAFGEPDGVQHGASVHFAIAAEGVSQQALSATYLMLHRGGTPLMLYGRLGVSILTAPDPNLGGELALGLGYFFTGALGLTAELVGNLFYGAGTYESEVTAIPTLALQAGIIVDFEVLP